MKIVMNWIVNTFVTYILFTSSIKAQQKYSGNSVMSCDSSDEDAPSESFLYSCNGLNHSCRAFLTFTARYPYNSVPIISALMSSNQYDVAQINNITSFTVFPTDEQVIIPVDCSCLGQYYQAKAVYQIPTENETYFWAGGDTLPSLSVRYNVSVKKISEANGFSDENPTLYPFTTILIPLHSGPLSSQSTPGDHNLPTSPLPGFSARKSKSNRVLSTAGIVAGGFSLLVVLIIIFVFLFHKRKICVLPCRESKNMTAFSPKDVIVEIASFDRALKVFKFSKIKKATQNFGSATRIKGSVYLGVFAGEVLAVKRKSGNARIEVNMLYKINHFNIVKLHGVCEHDGYSYLVFEYMKNGSLREWLTTKGSKDVKSWNQRIRIALDVANGLLYLHSFTKPAYAHSNIKSSHILLDCNMRAKLANFSLARTSGTDEDTEEMTTQIMGTKGYMAPEYLETDPITPKVDVFAFGMVLLELITGKYAVEHDSTKKLISTAIASIMKEENAETELSQFIEPGLGENGGMEHAVQVVKLSLSCMARDPADRPDMSEVASSLLKIQLNLKKLFRE
ncbi:lysM domain receptor-like kinase 4 [Olea europaea subsp. europaea]|uniref:LysM domain receptor-like kinase 4 n=1 Tax=Olea europaea subsp. europaea TaxID=158383 RepID=A0A8S0RXF3_OLEEU|nr:lysM domain receptor-like kinase 4 [Olea europaea subsp. europaea]